MDYLWEHFVLNELHAELQVRDIRYWRDKRGHEIDFVLIQRGNAPIVVECKWSASEFDASGLKAFRLAYLKGENFVVVRDVDRPSIRHYGDVSTVFVSLQNLIQKIKPQPL